METTSTTNKYPFLADGGEMGELTRRFDWSMTSLGPPDQWPLSLRTTVGLMLHSAFPMFLFWGTDLLCFYNDAYRPSLGDNGKHPALGKRAAEVWPEIWDFIGPMIHQVMTTGEPTFFEDQLVPIYRNGQLEDVYWTFSYSPAFGDTSQINGVFVVTTETTRKVNSINQLRVSEQRFQNLVREASVGIIVLEGEAMRVSVVNNAYARLIGHHPDALMGKPLFSVIPETEDVFRPIIDGVRLTGEPRYLYGQPYFVQVNGHRKDGFLDLVYQPYKEQDGRQAGVMVLCQDVTEQILARQKIEESEARFRGLLMQAPVAIAIFRGPTHIIELANEAHLALWGRRAEEVLDKPLFEALPEAKGQGYEELLANVMATGDPFFASELHAPLVRNGKLETVYFNFVYQPLREPDGTITGVIVVASDITEQVLARQAVEKSEVLYKSLVHEAPVATALLVGAELRIDVANDIILGYWGKTKAIMGLALVEALPEIAGQPFLDILTDVYHSGKPYEALASPASLEVDGVLGTYYFDFTYKPLRDSSGAVYAIMNMAVDVTEQVLARQKLEASEAKWRSLIAAAPVAIGLLVGPGHVIENPNQTFIDSLGKGPGIDGKPLAEAMPELITENQPFLRILDEVYTTGQPFYSYDSPIDIVRQGVLSRGYYNFSYTPLFDATGQVYAILDIAIDVTGQIMARQQLEASEERYRTLSNQLEVQVQERTEELAAANEELATTNEELAAANEELATTNEELTASNEEAVAANEDLSTSNNLLTRSNDNLEKFAYVASHDLQEPLRKIQSFGDLLKSQYATQLGDGAEHLERMQAAASRMSTLIRDLLAFSRIATQREAVAPVPLNDVLTQVMTDLELRIQETKATVTVGSLPTVLGDRSQLEQLFQNLLSNALKFRRTEVPPVIQVSSRVLLYTELPSGVKPARQVRFYSCIDVADNGIGFDEKYLDRIFQVFQRLNSKSQYAGTGIGLAICERVVTNHGGAIAARSQAGQGATFSVYLPQ